jgi:hypothetical protein
MATYQADLQCYNATRHVWKLDIVYCIRDHVRFQFGPPTENDSEELLGEHASILPPIEPAMKPLVPSPTLILKFGASSLPEQLADNLVEPMSFSSYIHTSARLQVEAATYAPAITLDALAPFDDSALLDQPAN